MLQPGDGLLLGGSGIYDDESSPVERMQHPEDGHRHQRRVLFIKMKISVQKHSQERFNLQFETFVGSDNVCGRHNVLGDWMCKTRLADGKVCPSCPHPNSSGHHGLRPPGVEWLQLGLLREDATPKKWNQLCPTSLISIYLLYKYPQSCSILSSRLPVFHGCCTRITPEARECK